MAPENETAWDMKYREMNKEDIPEILHVRTLTRENALSLEELADRGITPETVAHGLGESKRGWVCEADRRILGFTMGHGESGEVLVLAVLPEAEGKGIGRKLLSLVQSWLCSLGHRELWLMETPDPKIRAYGFYRYLGWQPTGEFKAGEQRLKLRCAEGKATPY